MSAAEALVLLTGQSRRILPYHPPAMAHLCPEARRGGRFGPQGSCLAA